MPSPILIGIHGVKRAGKDTTADFLTEFASESDPALSVRRRGFADKAKWSFCRQFYPDCTMDQAVKWVDAYKSNPRAVFDSPPIDYTDDAGLPIAGPLTSEVVFRDALAQFSTEGHRDIFGFDFWVDQLLPLKPDARNPEGWHGEFMTPPKTEEDWPYSIADICLVIDVRFENEVQRIHELGGFTWKIKRKDAEDAVIEEARLAGRDIHRSELGLPDHMFHAIIDNSDNDLDKARDRTRREWERVA